MSRTAAALLRSAPTASHAVSRLTNGATKISAANRAAALHTSRTNARSSKTNTISIDPRILDGTAGFLPRENVDRLIEWQTGLWERLAAEVRNNPGLLPIKQKWDESGLDMTRLLSETARDPSLTLAFNYASALVNNSYFLESINPSDEQLIPSYVEPTAAALKEKVEAYAEGIMGGGWLWLVRTGVNTTDLDIIPTFGSGTLLITQRAQFGRDDSPIFGTPSSSSYTASSSTLPASTPESSTTETTGPPRNQASMAAAQRGRDGGSKQVLPVPLAVLNLHEMAYLGSKYGVWDKKRYAGDWFRSLDWSRVGSRARA